MRRRAFGGLIALGMAFAAWGGATGTAWAVDTEPPQPTCTAVGNPHSGLYLLEATDNETATGDLQLFVHDTGSGLLYGPHASGTVLKYIISAAETDVWMQGGILFIRGTGPAELSAVDQAGNLGSVACPTS